MWEMVSSLVSFRTGATAVISTSLTLAAVAAYNLLFEGKPVLSCATVEPIGEQIQGEEAVFPITITNVGYRPLIVSSFRTSCSCATLANTDGTRVAEQYTILPQHNLELVARIGAIGTIGRKQTVGVSFASDDPSQPTKLLTLVIGRIIGSAWTQPRTIIWGRLCPN